MASTDRSTWPGWARALTTGWVLSPIIVIGLLAATFEGYGYYTRHQKTTYSRGGAFGGLDPVNAAKSKTSKGVKVTGSEGGGGGNETSTGGGAHVKNGGTHVSTLPAGTGGGGGADGSGTGGGGSSTTTGGTHTGGSSTPVTTHTPKSTPTHGSSPTPTPTSTPLSQPKTGVYTLAVSGSETAKFGPISACHNSFPSRAQLDVHHATGESPSSYDFDLRLYPDSPNKHDERHIYKYSRNSMTLSYEQETVTCSGIKQSTEVDYSPAQIRVDGPLKVGSSWHNHGGGSARTETGNSTVAKKGVIRIQGISYTVYEIVTKLALSGSETGERDQTWWFSPELGMPLKFSETLHGKRSGASYAESYSASVVGIP